jgi:hypothetical protein
METRDPSASRSRSIERPIPSVFPNRTWPGAAVASLITDDRWFDHHALLRWADDGGRWAEQAHAAGTEVRL